MLVLPSQLVLYYAHNLYNNKHQSASVPLSKIWIWKKIAFHTSHDIFKPYSAHSDERLLLIQGGINPCNVWGSGSFLIVYNFHKVFLQNTPVDLPPINQMH